MSSQRRGTLWPGIWVAGLHQRGNSGRYMAVHNIGRGPKMEDVLFDWKIIGHYRYSGPRGG